MQCLNGEQLSRMGEDKYVNESIYILQIFIINVFIGMMPVEITSSTSAGSAEEAEDRVGRDRSVRPSTEY